ncbi:hypothetical protein [uncultured Dysgonomonas sp.]|uniref:hypothetical protein n=1 Tax=uncultured Dysgonomonas sp. TaxID=206096 RepID=UPI00260BA061|nr:hypothetical protein [uncultured Dysgonomonas sp.]
MKALNKMNNLEKGKLLAALFPDEIKGISNTISAIYKMLTENREQVEKDWDNGFMTVGQWYRLAEQCNEALTTNNGKPYSVSRFAQEFFDGYIAIFTTDCVIKYAEKERKETKFWHMTQALFMFE